jgi:hypothetical protein
MINTPVGTCSSGFAWRSLDWSTYYMLTAGHCAPDGGNVYSATEVVPGVTYNNFEIMGNVASDTMENWDPVTGTEHIVGDLASANAWRGDIALMQIIPNPPYWQTSDHVVYADPGNGWRQVETWYNAWSAHGDSFCSDGMRTREMCGWVVEYVGYDFTYTERQSDGSYLYPTIRGANEAYKYGQCTILGDSGGPIYEVLSDGNVKARGIISGGGDNTNGSFQNPCTLTYTDLRDPWLGLPGTVLTGV